MQYTTISIFGLYLCFVIIKILLFSFMSDKAQRRVSRGLKSTQKDYVLKIIMDFIASNKK